MRKKRKDGKGRVLRTNETVCKDGRYRFMYYDEISGKRRSVYDLDLTALRAKEEQIARDTSDGIRTDRRSLTVNQVFDDYMGLKQIEATTRAGYMCKWNRHVRNGLGKMRVADVTPTMVKKLYAGMAAQGLTGTIKGVHNILRPALEMAVDDDVIRKNPCKNCYKEYAGMAGGEEREALAPAEQSALLEFLRADGMYGVYYPMVGFMLATGLRIGETIGLTWGDIDMKEMTIDVNHQLVYKNIGEGSRFYAKGLKTEKSERVLPITPAALDALKRQRKLQAARGDNRFVEVAGLRGFVFTVRTGRPYTPQGFNMALDNAICKYNRNPAGVVIPHVTAHNLRHSYCTRMAEAGMDIKTLAYLMGHSSCMMTMEVYNHVSEERARNEVLRVEKAARAV
jgi:integrase